MDLEQIKIKIDEIKNTKDIENIESILRYGDLGKQIVEVLDAVKKLNIQRVSNQRELLNSFAINWNKEGWHAEYIVDSDIDRYIEKTI